MAKIKFECPSGCKVDMLPLGDYWKCSLCNKLWIPKGTGQWTEIEYEGFLPIPSDDDFYFYRAMIDRVIDGDTIVAFVDLGFNVTVKETFRLVDVDAYEVRGEEREMGLKAKERLKALIGGGRFYIRTRKNKKGKYGRWLAQVILLDGRDAGQMLLKEGLARPYE